MTSRAVPVPSACSVRAREEAMSKCGDRPRYGSISCDGNGRTALAASESDTPSRAVRKNRASDTNCSTSASVGTTTTTRLRAAAAAAKSALAGGVNPLTPLPGTPSPRRPAAVLNKARSVRELEVEELMTCRNRQLSHDGGRGCVGRFVNRPAARRPARDGRLTSRPYTSARRRASGTASLLDDRTRGVPLLDRLEDDAAPARLDGIPPDDLIRGPVRALDQNVGLHAADDVTGRVLVEDRDGVDALERGQQLGPLVLGVDRAGGTLVAADRRVGIETDDQEIAVRARRRQVTEVAGMQDVEDAVGEDDALARGPCLRDECRERGGVERHPGVFLKRTSPVKRQVCAGR